MVVSQHRNGRNMVLSDPLFPNYALGPVRSSEWSAIISVVLNGKTGRPNIWIRWYQQTGQ
jgi:hypothetical protein